MQETLNTENKTNINWEANRAQFPVLQREVNGQPLVYLDNGASSQMPQRVIDRINAYHANEHSNVHRGIHSLSQYATDAYELARKRVQKFINARYEEEIIYTTGTTDSINLVAQSYGRKHFKEGDEILLTAMEHHANIVPWQMVAELTGATIKVIPMTDEGELLMDEFHALLSNKTKMVAVVHVSNALGTINPVEEIIEASHAKDIPVLVDGAQATPHSVIDVQELDADFYAFSAHKMCGPTGFGILYGKKELLNEMPPYRGGGDMIDKVTFEKTTWNDLPHKFEAGTPPISAGVGFAETIAFLDEIGMENIAAREQELLDYATEKLNEIDGLRIVGTARNKASVISFLLEGIHPTDAGTILDQKGIAVRTGHHCTQPIMDRFKIPGTARASISFYNNEEDIDRLAEGIKYVKEFF
ncbi:aminotransferase class V-fold PLP-dependent enzyme [Gracilimonas mengyeensis]|uniref:cysteine desulfurase n=1 Tax=Gracilimonas mengyeensis TaxID=1302730 RepID=A0A521ANQ3_9BACT|nr:cysteine desulfurase [Gracilimonas mengyeensis]SMO36447.1 cysteine desulfurase / selenocysteine lyase [Gracilimonas mengyeensis]